MPDETFEDACIYSYEVPTADPFAPKILCRYYGSDTITGCIGTMNCAAYKTMKPANYDIVSKPAHYTEGRKYEPKDVIRDWDLNFNLGNAVKYVARAGRKDDILQDLKKARQYLDFEIEYLEKEREGK